MGEKNTGTIAFRFRQVLLYFGFPVIIIPPLLHNQISFVYNRRSNDSVIYLATH